MLITCPKCTTSYEIESAKLGVEGRPVRCARCRTRWLASARREPDNAKVLLTINAEQAAPAGPWSISPQESPADLGWVDASIDETSPGNAAAADAGLPENSPPPILNEAPPLAPAMGESAPQPDSDPDVTGQASEDIESAAARRARLPRETRARRSRWAPGLPTVILALATIVAGLIAWRADVVRFAPQSAQLYALIGLPVNLRGLAFENVKTSGETHEDVPVLVVEGNIVNVANRTVEVPRLRFALRNPTGVEVYAWTALPGTPLLVAGEVLPFRSRLASPPTDTRDVMARFFHRRDLESRR